MQLTQLTANDTLLAYALVTSPSPVSVSPKSGPPSLVALSFVISCPISVGSVTVSQISFNLPVGDPKKPDASDLTETTAGINASVSSSGADQWKIGPGAAAGSFVLKPASGNPTVIDSQGLTVTFTGIQVGPIVGTALVTLVELATASTSPAQSRQCIVNVPKFPYAFYVGNFEASAPMIAHGGTVVLSWLGSVQATYTILWAQQTQDVSRVNQWTSPALNNTTTFILQVSAQEGGQTVTIQFSVTVIVADPDITATTLTVLNTTALAGSVTVGSTSAAASLAVNGGASATSVNAGALAVSGASNLAALTVSGAATAGSLQTPSLNAAVATLGATVINGLNARGGKVAMIGSAQSITPGSWNSPASFQAPTDGFAVGVIGFPSSVTDGCMCYGYGQTGGMTVYVTGGNMGFFGPGWSDYMASNPHSFIMPVAANAMFYVAVMQGSGGQQSNAPYWYYWVPVGAGAVGSELVALDKPGRDFHRPAPVKEQAIDRKTDRLEFIAILERIVGKPLDAVTKKQLLVRRHS